MVLRPPRSLFGLALAFAALCASAACGGGDDTSQKITIDPKRADELAHATLLAPTDLPGTGWTVTADDQFNDAGPTAQTPACDAIRQQKEVSENISGPERAGRAERAYSRAGKADVPTSVDLEVAVFNTGKVVAASLDDMKKAFAGQEFIDCLRDSILAELSSGVKADVREGKVQAPAPNDGFGRAADVTLEVSGQKLQIHVETYAWTYGNVGMQVTITGESASLPAELARAVLTKAQAKLEAAGTK